MTGVVNRVPFGLLGLLDMQARGQTPRLLDENLQIGIDGTELYTLQNREFVAAGTSTATAAGFFSVSATGVGIVPAGEIWYVSCAHVIPAAALAAGTTYRAGFGVQWNGVSSSGLVTGNILSQTAGEQVPLSYDPDISTRWWLPGYLPGVYVASLTLGTATAFTVRMWITRFRNS